MISNLGRALKARLLKMRVQTRHDWSLSNLPR
jgi:hypothetical protein